jgi:hypothetical protein
MVGNIGAGEGIRTLDPDLGKREITAFWQFRPVSSNTLPCAGVRDLQGHPNLNRNKFRRTHLNRGEGRRV